MTQFASGPRRSTSAPRFALLATAACLLIAVVATTAAAREGEKPRPDGHKVDVLTYHYDSLRTGWNDEETILKTANVKAPGFGLLHTVVLDDQVDTQPLIVTRRKIAGTKGLHDVVYVATEANSIYAVDADSGAVLRHQNFGTPVPFTKLPGNCSNNGPNVGINGTPVVDLAHETLYVITFTLANNEPVYHMHALDLATLADKIPPVKVTASHVLSNGSTYTFMAGFSRQRPGLLAANGNIYAGFGSFCDIRADVSRGWVLGWKAGTLTALPGNQLDDRLATAPGNFFLSSVWMSGYGLGADAKGDIYFSTGNSAVNSYGPPNNIQESVVKLSPDLKTIVDYFTPSGAQFGVNTLDAQDNDMGSAGVLLLPDQKGSVPHLAVIVAKVGQLYLMNRNSLGGYNPNGPDHVLGTFAAGSCWCGQSYFVDAAKVPHVVTSGGDTIILWKVATSPQPTLIQQSSSPALNSGQDPGFFTTISSKEQKPGTAIIWAVSRPTASPFTVTLHAFDPANLAAPLYTAAAGTWPNTNGNANIVPVVANGHVYVASNKRLDIFGLGGKRHKEEEVAALAAAEPAAAASPPESVVYGTIEKAEGAHLSVKTRTGPLVEVDASRAQQQSQSIVLVPGRPVVVHGQRDSAGVLHAETILHAKGQPSLWLEDR